MDRNKYADTSTHESLKQMLRKHIFINNIIEYHGRPYGEFVTASSLINTD